MKIHLTLLLLSLSAGNAWAESHLESSSSRHTELKETGSEMIDRLLKKDWAKQGMTPAKRTEDWEFLRRSSLDFLGRLPTPSEYEAFFKIPAEGRRSQWCERIISHPDTKDYWAKFWEETLIEDPKKRFGLEVKGPIERGMSNWKNLAGDILEGPLSVTVRERLKGEPIEAGKKGKEGAFDMIPMSLGATKTFLGTSLQCAQCHDHFFEPYTQQDFWGMTANFRNVKGKLPSEVTFKDAHSKELQTNASYFGRPTDDKTSLSKLFTEDPRFPRAITNQVWGQIFGMGLNAPAKPSTINDPNTPVKFPELLDALSKKFAESNFNQLELMSWICNSNAYSLSSEGDSDAAVSAFAQAKAKPMSAPQFTRTINGLHRQAGRSNQRLDMDNVAEILTGSIDNSASQPITPNAMLYMMNNERLREFTGNYWRNYLRQNPKATKTDAIQSAARLYMGKDLPDELLANYATNYAAPLSEELMTEISSVMMASRFFLWNR